jgi:site-specific recombinase XerD
MKEVEIQNLIRQCVAFFEENNYTRKRIEKYKSLWKNGIVKFMKANSFVLYNPPIGEEFTQTCHYKGTVRPQEREFIRSVQVLNDMITLGHIRKRCVTPKFHRLDGDIGKEMEKLIFHLSNLRRSPVTIGDYRLYLSEFLHYLNNVNVRSIYEITENHIVSFVLAHPTNKVNVVSALRVLFRYWKEEDILELDFSKFFESFKVRHPERIPSFFKKEEVMQIERSVSRSSQTGKRNYAMLLLSSRLGLRASDIANLRFHDIDWDNNAIKVVMQKTLKEIELPLLPDVGNAIIDYLKNGRPSSDIDQVFLSSRAPYIGATRMMVGSAINAIIVSSGIDVHMKHHGPHSLRHSLASALLKGDSSLPIISEALGHKHTDTTMVYLRIDVRSLLKCANPVPAVADGFYTQRGGAFYE